MDTILNKIQNYFDRNPQLHVLFIFDKMDMIRHDLQQVSWPEGYRYVIFDGAWFNAKYNIEHAWKDEHVVLLFRDIPYPKTEQQQLQFPLMDMLRANMEYKEDDYASFMQQYGLPEKYAAFIKKHIAELSTSKMTALLSDYYRPDVFSTDLVYRGLLSNYLGEKKLLEWPQIIVRMIILGLDSEEKKRNDFYNRVEKNIDLKKALDEKLTSLFGFSYNPNSDRKAEKIAGSLKYNALTQLLDVNPADTYKAYKVTSALILDQLNKIYDTGTNSRQYGAKFTEALRQLAADVREENLITWYGIDAQYFYMTEALGWPILKEIAQHQVSTDPDHTIELTRQLTMKLPENADIQNTIHFLEQMALYYQTVKSIDTFKLDTPDEYVSQYTTVFYRFDLFYRHALEHYHQLIAASTPIDDVLGTVKQQFDEDYAKTVNIMNLEWLQCVNENPKKFGSVSIPRQAQFYHEQVDKGIHMAVIISDALRYEVAAELMEELSKEKHIATLSPMLAMLPTETKYCKPSMLPHHELRLQGTEMTVDNLPVTSLLQRTELMQHYEQSSICISYEELMNQPVNNYREFFKQHQIIYIFHDTIDRAGHSQSPFEVIDSCKKAVSELRQLISRLHATWNVYDVLLTADHGFLYNDRKFEDKDKHTISENVIEKKSRYCLTSNTAPVEGVSKYPLSEVSEIQSATPVYVAVPNGTNRMAAPGGYEFAHGGATLEEMIVPVIYSKLRREKKTEKVEVQLMSHNLNMVSSRLKFQLIQVEAVSMTMIERNVVCQVFDGDKPVTEEKRVTLNSPDKDNLNNRVFEVILDLKDSSASSMLQLRVYDEDDRLNPLIKETVKNNTFIEQDF